MTAREKVLSIALAEVGYLEKRNNHQLDSKTANAGNKNYTKYARDLDAIGFYNGRKQGYSWCDVFVDWCFVQAFGAEAATEMLCQPMGKYGAGVKYSAQYYMAKGRFYESRPEPGDQIFFVTRKGISITGWTHTGIVEKVSDGYVYTIEGNTNGNAGVIANGGGVFQKKYPLNSKNIGGYGRPNWSLAPKEENEMTKKEVNELVDEKLAEAAPKTYYTVAKLPGWAQASVDRLLDAGIITGDGEHEINLTDNDLRTVSMVDKLFLMIQD